MSETTDHRSLACQVARELRGAGFRALFAGGCVRDLLLGKDPRDYDLATNATPDEVQRLFPRTVPIGAAFGVVLVVWKGVPFEVATFRSDGAYHDGRHPSSVAFGGEREDALRRDFTINGLFLEPETGEIIDHVGGRRDLDAGRIRTIGPPEARFLEDRLRLLRAVRFHADLGFRVEGATRRAIEALAPEIDTVSQERVRGELVRILTGPAPRRGFTMLEETGLLERILPEVAAMRGVPQPPEYHPEGDVWTHTLRMLEEMRSASPVLAMGVLLHDVGKPPTFRHDPGDRIRFHGHDAVGARLASRICRRLRFSSEEVRRIESLVGGHMRFVDLPRMREARVRRFLGREDIEDHLELHRLDCVGSHRLLDTYRFCKRELARYAGEPVLPPPLLGGRDLLALGFREGPLLGKILREVRDAQLERRLEDRAAAVRHVLERHAPGREPPPSGGGDAPGDAERHEEQGADGPPENRPTGPEQDPSVP